jgi:predicted small metal-binding protein
LLPDEIIAEASFVDYKLTLAGFSPRHPARADVFQRLPEHFRQELIMGRKYVDCREFPSESNCSVALSADTEKELLDAAAQHAVAVHKHQDTPELRQQLKKMFKEGTPPVDRPKSLHA